MRLIFFLLTFLASYISYSQDTIKIKKRKGRETSEVFAKLDSIVDANKDDTLFYCSPDFIKKVERITKIKATDASASFVGKIYFTLSDYKTWIKWRERRSK